RAVPNRLSAQLDRSATEPRRGFADSYSVALWRAHIERALRAAKTLRARFSDLARQPLRRRVAGHRQPQQLPTFVAENEKREQLLKRNRRNHEQINRRDPLH